jgi:hypothetical protein
MEIDPNVEDIVRYFFKNKEYILAQQLIVLDEKFAQDLQNELSMQLMFKHMADKDDGGLFDGHN